MTKNYYLSLIVKMASLFTVYQLYISSKFRTSGSISNFTTILQNPISCVMQDFVSEFRLMIPNAQIPYSFHEINQLNNSVSYTITRAPFVLTTTFTIPSSTYDIVSMANIFVSNLIASISALIGGGYIPNISVIYSYDKNKLTFTLTPDGTPTSITFNIIPDFTQVMLSLGFNATAILDDIVPLESFVSCNVSPSRSLYLLSENLIQSRSFNGYVTPTVDTLNVLCSIPITASRYNFIQYQPQIPTVNVLTNKTIDKINLYVQAESLNRDIPDMDLNWSVQMTIEVWVFTNIQRVLAPSVPTSNPVRDDLLAQRDKLILDLKIIKQRLSNSIDKDVRQQKKSSASEATEPAVPGTSSSSASAS
jgi:hypothetical protein